MLRTGIALLVLTALSACAGEQTPPHYNRMVALNTLQVSNFVDTLPLFLRLSTEIKQSLPASRDAEKTYQEYLKRLSDHRIFREKILGQQFSSMEEYMLVSFNVYQALGYIYRMDSNYQAVMTETYRSLLRKKQELNELSQQTEAGDTNFLRYRQEGLQNEFLMYSNMQIVRDFVPVIGAIQQAQP